MAIFSIFSTFLLCAIFVSIFQYANNLQSSWPPQPTPTWAGAKIHKLFDIQQALSNLEKIFRKPPDFSKSKTPGLVKANKNLNHIKNINKNQNNQNMWRPMSTAGSWGCQLLATTTKWPRVWPNL